jgi:hypothetical protein
MIKHKRRDQFAKITDEAVKIFVRHEQLAPIRDACIDDGECRSPNPDSEHCPECREYIQTNIKLGELLGREPWQASPVDAITADPPYWMTHNEDMCDSWRESWVLRLELKRLAGVRGLL